MAKWEHIDTKRLITSLFAAERSGRKLTEQILSQPHEPLLASLRATFEKALRVEEEEEQELRLICITRLLRAMSVPGTVDLLIDILDTEIPEVRATAGIAIQEVSTDRMDDVRRAVAEAVERLPEGSYALSELPFLILEMDDAAVLDSLRPFLAHKDPEAVSAAIQALTDYGNPEAIELLQALIDDTRDAELDDDSPESGKLTIGDLACEAIEALREVEEMLGMSDDDDDDDDDEPVSSEPGNPLLGN